MIPPDCDRPLLSCTWVTPVSSRVIVLLGWFVSNASIWAISDRAPSTTPASWAVNYNTQWTDVLDLHKSVDRCICSISIGHKMCKAGQNFISRQSQFHYDNHKIIYFLRDHSESKIDSAIYGKHKMHTTIITCICVPVCQYWVVQKLKDQCHHLWHVEVHRQLSYYSSVPVLAECHPVWSHHYL